MGHLLRRSVTSLAALGAAGAMYALGPAHVDDSCLQSPLDPDKLAMWLPVTLLLVSAALVHGRTLFSQLAARAVWWSNLVLGALVLAFGNDMRRTTALALLVATGVSLLCAGRSRLDLPSARFAPVAFRRSLMAIVVMALADVQSLFLIGGLSWRDGYDGEPTAAFAFLTVAALLSVALIGLFRLRVWGLALTALGNLGLIAAMLGYRSGLPVGVLVGYIAGALVQLVLMVPLIRAMLRPALLTPRDTART